ncbi:disease resistance protein RUN1 isoform X2 [Ziziphus jujuba]|nr:disease resistance protein RUN1 isoform X2 [Ziziphus jujuba]
MVLYSGILSLSPRFCFPNSYMGSTVLFNTAHNSACLFRNKRSRNRTIHNQYSGFHKKLRPGLSNILYKVPNKVTNLVASSSSSYSTCQDKYEVFLSFRGEDTRDGFIGHLYNALCQKHILTFKDDENLESGHKISEIMEAIKESKICIIVFSKDFASSTWCLDEVVRILDCKRYGNDIIIPIFYGIEPSIVRKQDGSYAEAFNKHEQRFKNKMDKVQQWRDALKEVTNLSGYDSKNFRPEYKFIDKVVEDILLKLSKYPSTYDHSKQGLVGIKNQIKEVEGLLGIGSMDVRIIGLYGMGGIGKTTLAEAVFQNLYHHFESHCFLRIDREEFHLREKLVRELLKDKTDNLSMESPSIQDRLRRTKVLIVLDDLDDVTSQFDNLLSMYKFGGGSRIIVTSRDVQVLRTVADQVYEVKRLNDFEALELFHLHAFKQNSDLARDYATLSEKMANYTDGNPLALKVLGSSLYSKSIKDWESALEELQSEPNKNIEKVLRISFDQLGRKDKKGYTAIQDAFLDIACYFLGEVDREFVESIIDRGGASKKISDLIDKCLIIEGQNGLSMHSLIRQMGQTIVCDESKEPGNRTRLWKAKDISRVLAKNTGSYEIEGILLDQSELENDVHVKSTAFSKMNNLRFLKMHCDKRFGWKGILLRKLGLSRPHKKESCKIIYLPPEGLESFDSNELRYFQWDSYRFKDLPSDFRVENVVELVMRESQLVELNWDEEQVPVKLKKLDLRYSEHLIRFPNLSGAINLERINLEGCKNLVEIPSFFKDLHKLKYLNLSDCDKLEGGIENLPLNIRDLKLRGTAIKSLPECIWKMKYLKEMDISRCQKLEKLPEIPEDCTSSSLGYLNITGCGRLKTIPELPPCLSHIEAECCTSLETISSWTWRTPTAKKERRYVYKVNHSLKLDIHTGNHEIADYGGTLAAQDVVVKKRHYIYNFSRCLKLDSNSRNQVIADRSRTLIAQDLDDISYLETVYPGDEIPEWFSHKTDRGNSVDIQLPPNWFNVTDTRFDFIFCIVFVYSSSTVAETRFELNFKTNNINSDDDCVYNYDGGWLPHTGSKDEDHVLIRCTGFDLESAFGAKWSSICSNFTQVSIRVFVEGKDVKWEIKKCGFKLLHGQGASKRQLDDDPNIKFQEEMKNLETQPTVSFELDDMFKFI